MAIDDHVVPLSVFALDYPEPPDGWAIELRSRAIPIVEDDLGRAAIPRVFARELLVELRQLRDLAAQHRERVEAEAVARDQAFRVNLPRGIPAGHVPDGVSAGALMMLSDPMDKGRQRVSVLEHALQRGDGAVYHPLAPAGGDS